MKEERMADEETRKAFFKEGRKALSTPTFGSKPYHFLEGKLYDRHGKEVDPGECVIFKVTDYSLLAVLDTYYDELKHEGTSPDEHVRAVEKLFDEVKDWQNANANRVKAAN